MTLKLITAPAELLTLADAKQHLRLGSETDDDTLVASLITSARLACEHVIGRGIGLQTWRRTLDAFPAGGIALGMPPVSSITSVQYVDTAGAVQTLDADAYTLDAASDAEAWAVPAYGASWPSTLDTGNAVTVTFVCGLAALPDDLRSWMLLHIGTLYRHRESIQAGQVMELPGRFTDALLDRWRVWGA